ncbi:MAG: hypothetical protein LQ338_004376 [Usnochroma carphineum]|nr:MAG: hypothetical protein LQ338_004376 [Usnochroma carphineum]
MSSSSSTTTTPQHSPIYHVPRLCPAPNSKSPYSLSAAQLPYTYSPSDCYAHSNPSTPSYDCFYTSDLPDDIPYMTSESPYNPSIRIEQSTPNYALLESPFNNLPSMVEGNISSWDSYDRPTHLSPQTLQRQSVTRGYRGHKRISSDSSITSVGPESPYTQTLAYPQIVDPDSAVSVASGQFDAYDSGFPSTAQYSKSQYAPQTSQNHESFLAPAFQDYNPATADPESYQAVQTAMRQALMEQQRVPSLANQSHSSRGSFEVDYNELSRITSAGRNNNTAKLNRTMSDIYQDELYNPSIATSVPPQQPQQYIPQENYLSPQKNTIFNELLQAAQNGHVTARSASPTSMARERSPFAPGSQYAAEKFSHSTPNSPARLHSAAQMREQQKAESDARAYEEHHSKPSDFVAPPTISPKEVALDYNETEEDAKQPLFNQNKRENQLSTFASNTPNSSQSDVDDNTSERSYRNMGPRRQRGSNLQASTASGQSGSNITFMPPSVPGNIQMPQTYPFIAHLRRQSSSLRSTADQAPEFPTQLTSMESSRSETQSEIMTRPDFPSSAESTQRSPSSPAVQRPSDTAAATGSYTCTSPNCTARFDTSTKLQKHRREAHRSSPPRPTAVAPTTSSTTTPTSPATPSSSSAPANRAQQAGPHKCERINPSTGKPCNTVFSRSYDLTRHEDTIHNNRKQKVRCHLCTEEKTFSRNDALTRHMRVVHPDVDFPGKTKRRGG